MARAGGSYYTTDPWGVLELGERLHKSRVKIKKRSIKIRPPEGEVEAFAKSLLMFKTVYLENDAALGEELTDQFRAHPKNVSP
jgi:hypothetical protein